MGLPGAGKTTVFNALAQQRAEVGSFGGAEAHRAVVRVPDDRLTRLSEMFHPRKTTPAEVRYVDVAGGMVAAGGEAKAAARIGQLRTADELCHVVRAFESDTHPHPRGSVDPRRDFDEMMADLVLADLSIVEKRVDRLDRELRMGKAAPGNPQWRELELLKQFKPALEDGRPIREFDLAESDRRLLRPYGFLSEKPMLVILNTGDDVSSARDAEETIRAVAGDRAVGVTSLAGRLEMELGELDETERLEFMRDLGIEELGLGRVVRLSYQLLDLVSFFTVGEDECRAWTVGRAAPATEAAAQIHSDIARGFIRAEVVRYEDLVESGGLVEARKAGQLRSEGKTYPVQDGDVINFLFNV
ncbi:MAG: redox-regulated ATPase YchF [Chloroflexota bacterium]|nr:MAG: redox-regulated ATPase YchF [Chloroflexota bacterium]